MTDDTVCQRCDR